MTSPIMSVVLMALGKVEQAALVVQEVLDKVEMPPQFRTRSPIQKQIQEPIHLRIQIPPGRKS